MRASSSVQPENADRRILGCQARCRLQSSPGSSIKLDGSVGRSCMPPTSLTVGWTTRSCAFELWLDWAQAASTIASVTTSQFETRAVNTKRSRYRQITYATCHLRRRRLSWTLVVLAGTDFDRFRNASLKAVIFRQNLHVSRKYFIFGKETSHVRQWLNHAGRCSCLQATDMEEKQTELETKSK